VEGHLASFSSSTPLNLPTKKMRLGASIPKQRIKAKDNIFDHTEPQGKLLMWTLLEEIRKSTLINRFK